MSEDQIRAEFEEWFSGVHEGWVPAYSEDANEFSSDPAQQLWAAWQASRKALCVELPEPCDKYETTDIKRCKKALEEAGVAYK